MLVNKPLPLRLSLLAVRNPVSSALPAIPPSFPSYGTIVTNSATTTGMLSRSRVSCLSNTVRPAVQYSPTKLAPLYPGNAKLTLDRAYRSCLRLVGRTWVLFASVCCYYLVYFPLQPCFTSSIARFACGYALALPRPAHANTWLRIKKVSGEFWHPRSSTRLANGS